MSNRAKEIAAIMTTYEGGQKWEFKTKLHGLWLDCADGGPAWDWFQCEYRRKPTPRTRTRPMVFDELPPLGTLVRSGQIEAAITWRRKPDCFYAGASYIPLGQVSNWEWFNVLNSQWLPFTITENRL